MEAGTDEGLALEPPFAMNEILEKRLYNLSQSDISDWVPERTARRGEEYRNRVGAIVSAGDCLAAKVRGTEEYTTNLFVDSHGEFVSVCSCPVGRNCKHGVALALCASEKLKAGETIPEASSEKWRLDREAILSARPAARTTAKTSPSPSPVRIRVETNPFDRFTPSGGRHGKDFSFRVVTPEKTYHWDFVIMTLVYLLAKGGFNYDNRKEWNDERNDWPLFACSCGSVECGGFGRQSCVMTGTTATLTVAYHLQNITFEFDRVRLEYWALLMLRRMRGSRRLRRDPWRTALRSEALDDALETLFAIRPRCREIWQRLKYKRTFDESDFTEVADLPTWDGQNDDVHAEFVRFLNFTPLSDWSQSGVHWEDRARAQKRLEEMTVSQLEPHFHGTLIGRGWQKTRLDCGDEITFIREVADEKGRPVIRVANAKTGATVGCLKYAEAIFLTAMMDRHGLVLRNHVESSYREGSVLPIRIDFQVQDNDFKEHVWSESINDEMLPAFFSLLDYAQAPGRGPVSELREGVERIQQAVCYGFDCPEISFLVTWLLSSVREIEDRLTKEEMEKRCAYCDAVRKALTCEPVGELIAVGEVTVLPLRATFANGSHPPDGILARVRNWIRLVWLYDLPRPHVTLPEFPQEATGFAAFRGRDLLDVCLTGIPLAGSNLFDNFALYDRPTESPPFENAQEAFAAATAFLATLPIRERDKNGLAPHFWLEHGIHDGTYEIDEAGRLVALRIIRMIARKRWVD